MQADSPPMQASFATLPSRETKATRSREASIFARFARWAARQFGRSIAFTLAFLTIIVWAATGPLFGWSDTWQLVINTGTTIVTFLMVFVIQNTQNRDTEAIHLKLDELIRVNKAARNSLMSLEEQPDSEVEEVKSAFADLAAVDKSPTREQKARPSKG